MRIELLLYDCPLRIRAESLFLEDTQVSIKDLFTVRVCIYIHPSISDKRDVYLLDHVYHR